MTTGAISRANLHSNRHHKQTDTQLFTARIPFLSPNQQCQSNEGKIKIFCRDWLLIYAQPRHIRGLLKSRQNWSPKWLFSAIRVCKILIFSLKKVQRVCCTMLRVSWTRSWNCLLDRRRLYTRTGSTTT